MAQFINLCKYSLHVPSVARAHILPTPFLRRPQIYVEYFNGSSFQVNYPLGVWATAQKDYENLLYSIQACQAALNSVNLIQPTPDKKVKSVDSKSVPTAEVCLFPSPKFESRSPPSIA